MQVLLEPVEDGILASTGAPLNLSVKGTTEWEALSRLEREIEQRFSTGARVVELAVSTGEAKSANPIVEFAGDMRDDPLFDVWRESMRVYREQRDAELEQEEQKAA